MKLKKVRFRGVDFKVSSCGTKVIHEGRELRQSLYRSKNTPKEYYKVYIKRKTFFVHHIVAAAFVHNPKPINYKIILHKDSNSLNNDYKNLEFCDAKILHHHRRKNEVAPVTREMLRGSCRVATGSPSSVLEWDWGGGHPWRNRRQSRPRNPSFT